MMKGMALPMIIQRLAWCGGARGFLITKRGYEGRAHKPQTEAPHTENYRKLLMTTTSISKGGEKSTS